ncbi:MAG: hypothetical protein ACJ796_10430 [Gemmatimonadaceae bacterium]
MEQQAAVRSRWEVARAHLQKLRSRAAIPPWVLLVWSLLGHASTLEQIRTWWKATWPVVAPFLREWNQWLAFSLALLWLTFLILRPPRPRSSPKKELQRQRDDWKQRAEELEAKERTTRLELDSALWEYGQLRNEMAREERNRREFEWRVRFGRPPLTVGEPMADVRARVFDVFHTELEKLRQVLRKLRKADDEIAYHLTRHLSACGSLGYEAAMRFEESTKKRLGNAFDLIEEPGGEDLRVALILVYHKHNEFRQELLRLAQSAGPLDLRSLPNYTEWKEADDAFFTRLDEAMEIKVLQSLANEIQSLRENRKYPVQMPPANTGAIKTIAPDTEVLPSTPA